MKPRFKVLALGAAIFYHTNDDLMPALYPTRSLIAAPAIPQANRPWIARSFH